MTPARKFSQVFLTDKNILRKIINSIDCSKDTPVLEVGPGRGALTQYLLKSGFRVVAIEIDPRLCELLRLKFHEYLQNNSLILIRGDFLKLDIKRTARQLKTSEFCVVSNIPYHITGPILEKFCFESHMLPEVYLTVQWEVARRMIANPGTRDYGALSIMLQTIYIPKILFRIKKTSFFPVPDVDSGFVSLIRRQETPVPPNGMMNFFSWTRRVFQYRRKTLRKILKEMNCTPTGHIEAETLKLRPEMMSVEDLYSLFLRVNCTQN